MYKLFIGVAAVSFSAMSFAQQSALEACAHIEDSLERLVCYDNLAKQGEGKVQQPQELPQKARKSKQKAAEVQAKTQAQSSNRFGFEHKKQEGTEQERIDVTLAERNEGPYGKWRMTLANGQVWKQTDNEYFSWDGNAYYIERGALNSFFFGREGSNRRMRVKRIK